MKTRWKSSLHKAELNEKYYLCLHLIFWKLRKVQYPIKPQQHSFTSAKNYDKLPTFYDVWQNWDICQAPRLANAFVNRNFWPKTT